MKKLIVSLLILLSTTLNSAETTTQNLLDTNFDNGGWSGTADGRHGSSVIAAEHDVYIESSSISLRTDASLTEEQIQYGFTTNHSFEYWHWNTYESTVQSTQTIIGADGETITQIRTYNSTSCGSLNCGSYSPGSDSVVVQSNLQTDYDVSVRYDFTDTSFSTTSHYGVDLRNPSLTVTYESDPIVLDNTTTAFLNSTFDDITEDLKFEDLKFEDEIKFEDNFTFDEPMFETFDEPKMEEPKLESFQTFDEPKMEEFKDEPTMEEFADDPMMEEFIEDMPMEMVEEKEEKPVVEESIEVVEDEKQEEGPEELKEESSSEEPTQTAESETTGDTKQEKEIRQAKVHSALVKTLDKIDENIKDIDKNLQAKNFVKINAMVDNSILLNYNIPFYKDKKIYEEQLNIFDDRLLYTKTLGEYQQSDPIFIQQNIINDIKTKKEKLLREIEVLNNG
jgi:hypothetical protein